MYMIRTTKEKHGFFGETVLRPLLSRDVVTMFSADPNSLAKAKKNGYFPSPTNKSNGSSNSS